MSRQSKTFLVIGLSVFVVVLLVVAFALGMSLGFGASRDSSQNAGLQISAQPPAAGVPKTTPDVSVSAPGTIPYVGPIDSPIIGKWERQPNPNYEYDHISYLEFTPDGTLYVTSFHILDADYPENWNTRIFDYSFDTWRDITVFECEYFRVYKMRLRVEFYVLDGRQAMDIITITEDGEEAVDDTLLKMEE